MIPGFAGLNYYEILDVSMGVDAKEVQEAYYLVREAFSKNSLSSYSLYTQEEREEIGKLIEEAYHILFDDQSRHDYSRSLTENRVRADESRKVVLQAGLLPFDEVEALRAQAEAEAVLAAADAAAEPSAEVSAGPDDSQGSLPFVDEFTPPPAKIVPAPEAAPDPAPPASAAPADEKAGEGGEPSALTEVTADPTAPAALDSTPPPSAITTQPIILGGAANGSDPEISTGPRRAMLDHLRDGITGPSLRRIREQRGLTLDQAFEVTRIRKPILQGIEDDEFDKLPAAVFLRGMVANYARFLGLPDPETIAKNYMERMTAALGG